MLDFASEWDLIQVPIALGRVHHQALSVSKCSGLGEFASRSGDSKNVGLTTFAWEPAARHSMSTRSGTELSGVSTSLIARDFEANSH